MKLTVRPDGAIELEADDIEDAVSFARGLRKLTGPIPQSSVVGLVGTLASKADVAKPKRPRGRPKKTEPVMEYKKPLTVAQEQTWTWLVAHDVAAGLLPADMANDMGITTRAAEQRVRGLLEAGLARRVGRGRYRAGERKK